LACSLRCDGRRRDVSNPAARHTTVRSPTLCDRGLAAPSRHFQSSPGGTDRPVDGPLSDSRPLVWRRHRGSTRLGAAGLFEAVRPVRWSLPSSRGWRCGRGCCVIAER
jgi:hypothetical protein